MEIIVKAITGSQLYGLATPTSDIDYKGVYIPDAEDILLNKTPKTSINDSGKGQDDTEMYTLLGFMNLLKQGQTGAIELLFAPADSIVESSPLWVEIQNNRDKFLHSNISSFIGYCKSQAHKNSLKHQRIVTLKKILKIIAEVLERHALHNLQLVGEGKDQLSKPKIGDIIPLFKEAGLGKCDWDVSFDVPNEDKKAEGFSAYFMEVHHQKIHYALSLGLAQEQLKAKLDEYGARANSLTTNADWKALSHAVRVGQEAIELLSTGKIEFPLDDAEYLLMIKNGERSFKEVSEEIDNNLEHIKYWEENSVLPKEIDTRVLDEIVLKKYKQTIGEM